VGERPLPLQQGRTLFYRDGVIVDTQYSNLSPTGYTDAVIDALWPASGGPSRFATSSSRDAVGFAVAFA
jgi:hypothetical protein